MKKTVLAIFDIGKTNKKFTLFDENFEVALEEITQLEETADEDGFPCEDVHSLTSWILEMLGSSVKDKRYKIEGVNFTTYGASFVHINAGGQPATPLYNYLKPFPEDLLHIFYQKYGTKADFSLRTASPSLGMLNSGLQLYWLKNKRAAAFRHIQYSLHLPQYCSYLIHRKAATEMTSIGCHTGLWDYHRADYHPWVYQEGIADKFPDVVPIDQTYPVEFVHTSLPCGVGVHDSSAALIPYLRLLHEPFLLVSTGTWSITLNSFSQDALDQKLLDQDCLNFLTLGGDTVRASRLFLGHEHSLQVEKMEAFFQVQANAYKKIKPDRDMIFRLLEDRKKIREKPGHVEDNNQLLPDYEWGQFSNMEEAYHWLIFDLVRLQVNSIMLAKGSTDVKKVIVTGGFCDNEIFLKLLANQLPGMSLITSRMKRASAIGAGLLLRSHMDEETRKSLIDFKVYQPDPEWLFF